MKTEKVVNGTYGSSRTACTVFVFGNWYVCEGGQTVNATYDEIEDGVNIEELNDYDCFTWSSPIESLEELINAVHN